MGNAIKFNNKYNKKNIYNKYNKIKFNNMYNKIKCRL